MHKSWAPEWVKNLLIVLLSLSAVALLIQSPLYVGSPLQARVRALFATAETAAPVSVSLTAAARPTRVAVVNEGGRYGAQYDSETVDAVFDALGSLLGEALGSAEAPFSISTTRWQQALTDPGVYFDFAGAVPFSALSGWLRGGEVELTLTANVRRVALAAGDGEDDVWLFWQDGDTGLFHASVTGLGRALHLDPSLTAWAPNAAFFAFEDPAYSSCAPYTLITATPAPVVYAAATPLSADDSAGVEQVLAALSYSTSSGSSYPTSDGTRYMDGNDTFLLTAAGTLSYHAADSSRYPVSAQGGEATTAECIETTRALMADTLGQFCGEARLYLISVRQEGEELVITYGYSLDGAPVLLYQEGWAARFVVADGAISEFTLHFRAYTATANATLLLPELQAAAALDALDAQGRELLLTYRDTGGESVSAGWSAT